MADVRTLITDIMDGEFSPVSEAYQYNDLHDPLQHYGGEREVFLVAEKDDEIVGTVAIKEDGPDTALLRRIFVKKEFRGKGYGDSLLNEAIDFCLAHKYRRVAFRGTDRMQTALRLCLKKGFAEDDVAELGGVSLVVLSRPLSE
ncbi:MAG: GNAT family N-acetyltransferase [Lentisphaerae bacterium]|nr:GNAT family N-acetyltransferase [Lentisphaerota bacterium]